MNDGCLQHPSDAPLDAIGIDSVGMIELVYALENRFAIEIGDDEVAPENFTSIESLDRARRPKMPLNRPFAATARLDRPGAGFRGLDVRPKRPGAPGRTAGQPPESRWRRTRLQGHGRAAQLPGIPVLLLAVNECGAVFMPVNPDSRPRSAGASTRSRAPTS